MTYRDDPDALRAREAWLSTLRIATPCDASWDAMSGDDRVRRCGLCDRDVYDVSRMTSAEAQQLFASGRPPCVRLHRRRDGRLITSDCARGVAKRKRRLALAGAAAVCASALAAFGDRAIDAMTPRSSDVSIAPAPVDRQVLLPRYGDPRLSDRWAALDEDLLAVEDVLGEPLPRTTTEGDLERAQAEVDALLAGTIGPTSAVAEDAPSEPPACLDDHCREDAR